MKIRNLLVIFLVLLSIGSGISPAAAAESNFSEWFHNLIYGAPPPALELHAAPGGTVAASPGQSILFNIRYFNQYPSHQYFQTEIWQMSCGAIDGFYIGKTGSTSVMPGTSGYDQISLTAPNQAGTYSYSLISYYGSSPPPENFDDEKCVTVIVSNPATPGPTWPDPVDTPAPSETPTPPGNMPPVAKITYTDNGNGKLVLMGTQSTDSDGTIESYEWFVDGELKNSQSTFTQVFDTAGSHEIKLIVTDDMGTTAQAVLMVGISKTDSGEVKTVYTDDSQTTSPPPATERRTGVWIEDGALKVPGFEGILSGFVLIYLFAVLRRK